MKFTFEQDNDCHWYLIHLEDQKRFNELLANGESDEYEEFSNVFGSCTIDGHPSMYAFENPCHLTLGEVK